MLAEILSQADKAAKLAERALRSVEKVRGLRSGDRVYTPLVVSAEFSQGAAPSANLVFNVPADADFWAYRLLLYPYCKIVDPVNGTPDEVVYRSTSFSMESSSPGAQNPAFVYSDFNSMIDATFALIYQGKELQNIEVPAAAAYCANTEKWTPETGMWGGASQSAGGLVFDVPMFLPRSKSLVCRVTPTYLGVRTKTDTMTPGPVTITRQHKYKIVGVLEGEKKVTAFR